jgi:hypothetical protein
MILQTVNKRKGTLTVPAIKKARRAAPAAAAVRARLALWLTRGVVLVATFFCYIQTCLRITCSI